MKKSDELKKELRELVTSQDSLVKKAEGEKRSLTTEENTEFDDLQSKIDEKRAEIKRAEAREENLRSIGENGPSVMPTSTETGDGEKREKNKLYRDFRITRGVSMSKGGGNLSGVENEVNQIALEELRANKLDIPEGGVNIPASMLRASYRAAGQTAAEDNGEYGGVLVNEGPGEFLAPFLPKLTVEALGVKVITGLTGKYPLLTSEQFEFQNLGETEEADETKIKYSKRVLDAMRSACVALISNQLLIQSSIDVENDVRQNIGRALNRKVFYDLIYGDGTAPNPLGILNDDILDSTATQGVITLAKVLELEGLLEGVDATDVALSYLTNPKVINIAKQTKLDAGSGIMLGDRDGLLYGAATNKSTQIVSSVGSGGTPVYPLLYGDWSTARVLFWGGANIKSDPYTKMGSNQQRLVINVHKNSGTSNPKAFAANKLITLS